MISRLAPSSVVRLRFAPRARRGIGRAIIAPAVLIALVGLALPPVPARAQVAVLVSGEPITQLDITTRQRLMQLIARQNPSREETIEELIDERLKIREARRWGALPSDSEIDSAFASTAQRAGMSAAQFTQALAAGGSDVRTFKNRLRAEIAWSQLVRARFRAATQVGERDVTLALTQRNAAAEAERGIEYRLQQVVFVVPRRSPPAAYEARKREAEALRARFTSCEEGLAIARGLREVVVRSPLTKVSGDLTPALRTLFANTPDGRLTEPERSEAGIEMAAVCSRREVSAGQSAVQTDLKQELISERIQAHGKRYLEDLRRAALIERRG